MAGAADNSTVNTFVGISSILLLLLFHIFCTHVNAGPRWRPRSPPSKAGTAFAVPYRRRCNNNNNNTKFILAIYRIFASYSLRYRIVYSYSDE